MKAEERRQLIARTLTADQPVSATALAGKFSVSRQIIVGDIALLRASGMDIVATPRGYKLGETSGLVRAVACVHSRQDTERELLAIVDNGCTVIDVVVDHPLYGQMTGQLSIASRYDVRQFVEKAQHAAPLSSLTDGLHIHNLRCPDEESYQRVCRDLEALGVLYTPSREE
ncbi:MAG: transcription repressor NadR [Evtepia sp.]|uniref:transcription repressor NadR n=1 Tax=Evtepia sp. TaxID=2773933 RepID=UPI002A75FF05|nr:transcription repressor NadR [Evtepia sp.]MDY3014888.1 transcription repressor NadR [Evtepia sp.]